MKLRMALVTITVVGLALGVTGCNLIQAQSTTTRYEASDGVNVTMSKVALRNLVIISDDGETGNLLFDGVNTSGSDVTVTLRYEQNGTLTEQKVTIKSSDKPVPFGDTGQSRVILTGIGTQPGGMLTMFFGAKDESIETMVPVLNTDQIQYENLAPTPTVSDVAPIEPTATPTS